MAAEKEQQRIESEKRAERLLVFELERVRKNAIRPFYDALFKEQPKDDHYVRQTFPSFEAFCQLQSVLQLLSVQRTPAFNDQTWQSALIGIEADVQAYRLSIRADAIKAILAAHAGTRPHEVQEDVTDAKYNDDFFAKALNTFFSLAYSVLSHRRFGDFRIATFPACLAHPRALANCITPLHLKVIRALLKAGRLSEDATWAEIESLGPSLVWDRHSSEKGRRTQWTPSELVSFFSLLRRVCRV